jgi:hypothetical protein
MTTEHNHRDLTATDITAKRLHMEIERENYREPNRTKPLLEMFTERHTEGSRNYGQMAYRMECRITLPEAYQMTTEKPTDVLQKLPTETRIEKSIEKSTAKLPSNVYYQVDQDSLKHRRYCSQPPPEDFHRGRRIRMRKITGKDQGRRYRKTNTSVTYQTLHRDDYQQVDRKVTDTYSEQHF